MLHKMKSEKIEWYDNNHPLASSGGINKTDIYVAICALFSLVMVVML